MSIKTVKRFTLSVNGIKNNETMSFTNAKGETFVYNQKIVFEQIKDRLEAMNCWEKYKNYTNSKNLPTFVRNLENLV